MEQMSSVKKSSFCALCIALCLVLPPVFHAIGAGAIFLPMHLPVFVCALICGWGYGIFCGVAGCILSSLLTGMPTVASLPAMGTALAVYGLVAGLLFKTIRTGNIYKDLYLSLIPAMLLGRVAAGIVNAWIFAQGVAYSMALWASAYFLTSWPGTVLILIFVPILIVSLMRARLIPNRYADKKERKPA